MNEPVPAPNQARPPARPPRISLQVAVIGFAGAVALTLLLIVLILATDPGRADADDDRSPSPPPDGSGLAHASPSDQPTSTPRIGVPTPSVASVTPRPSQSPGPYPISGSADPPLMVAGPDGGVYAAARGGDGVAVGLFGPDGRVRPGWPVRLNAYFCSSIHAAADGSLRIACSLPESGSEGLEPPVMRIFAIDARGRPISGWPVDIESGWMIETLGNDVAVVIRPYQGDVLPDGEDEPALFAMIGPDGTRRTGTREIPISCCESSTAIGPAAAYIVNRTHTAARKSSELVAFGLDGVEWRSPIDGIASDPAFDARGNAHVSVWIGDPNRSRTLVFDEAGKVLSSSSEELRISPSNGSAGTGPEWPAAPTVAADGSSFLVADTGGARILAIGPDGTPSRGWPYQTAQWVGYQGECGAGDTGCGLRRVRPAVGPDGTLYVTMTSSKASSGNSLIALSPGGRMRSGWPVGLQRPGAQFWQIVVGSDGGIWTLAAEPDRYGYDATLLSIAPDSTIRGKVTIVEAAAIGP
jgi:hypothetical protein